MIEVLNLFDEEPEPYGPKERRTQPERGEPKQNEAKVLGIVGTYVAMANRTFHQRGNAPPLDWWVIDDDRVGPFMLTLGNIDE